MGGARVREDYEVEQLPVGDEVDAMVRLREKPGC